MVHVHIGQVPGRQMSTRSQLQIPWEQCKGKLVLKGWDGFLKGPQQVEKQTQNVIP